MHKSVVHLVAGILVTAIAVGAALLLALCVREPKAENILAQYQQDGRYGSISIRYPLDETLFPPEIAAPTFHWDDGNHSADFWLVTVKFQDGDAPINVMIRESKWLPEKEQWEIIKKRSLEKDAQVTILGTTGGITTKIRSASRITIRTSKDQVGAPVFYREVNLPFVDAVKDPSRIRWRFGDVSSPQQPPIVLENLPVCGNCHSFSRDGKTIGLDVDYANDKGSYAITEVAEEMLLAKNVIITWSDYKKEDKEDTFGLLSQVSPDGRVVVSTVKDKSVFVPRPDLAFSQLFFPFKGILAVYDRQKHTFQSLSGADDPQYVQSNPSWSPDGKDIVFARAKAYDLKRPADGKVLLSPEDCKEFLEDGKPFLFDLYKMPFNDGKGGVPEPIEGASNNGMSNFFARYSPDGKWIVFCKAKSYMLLQPDSELHIIPASGGQARRLRANTGRMNSWHSWSPNGKWLVFSSKAYSDYTQLCLTHIDEQGNSSPAVLLERFTAPDRAANIPEFVNASLTAIKKIREQFVDDNSFVRAANELLKADDFEAAEKQIRKALELNPKNAEAHYVLARVLDARKMFEEAISELSEAVRLDPNYADAHYNLAQALLRTGKLDEAIGHLSIAVQHRPQYADAQSTLGAILITKGLLEEARLHLSEAVRLDPNNADAHYNLAQVFLRQGKIPEAAQHLSETVRLRPEDADVHYQLGVALARKGKLSEAADHWLAVVKLDPNNAEVHYMLATAMASMGKLNQTLEHYGKAVQLRPQIDISPRLHDLLGMNYAHAGRFQEAITSTQKACDLARAAGDETLAKYIERKLEFYRQNKLPENSSGQKQP